MLTEEQTTNSIEIVHDEKGYHAIYNDESFLVVDAYDWKDLREYYYDSLEILEELEFCILMTREEYAKKLEEIEIKKIIKEKLGIA